MGISRYSSARGGRQRGNRSANGVETEDHDRHRGGDEDGTYGNVVRFPRDWLGPRSELVPFGPAADRLASESSRATSRGSEDPSPPPGQKLVELSPSDAVTQDNFWGGDLDSIPRPVMAPGATPGPDERVAARRLGRRGAPRSPRSVAHGSQRLPARESRVQPVPASHVRPSANPRIRPPQGSPPRGPRLRRRRGYIGGRRRRGCSGQRRPSRRPSRTERAGAAPPARSSLALVPSIPPIRFARVVAVRLKPVERRQGNHTTKPSAHHAHVTPTSTGAADYVRATAGSTSSAYSTVARVSSQPNTQPSSTSESTSSGATQPKSSVQSVGGEGRPRRRRCTHSPRPTRLICSNSVQPCTTLQLFAFPAPKPAVDVLSSLIGEVTT